MSGAITTYTYGATTSCGNSFVTGTTVTGTGLPSNPALSTSAAWDTPNCYGAVQLSATDANNQTTHTYYTDRSNNIWRPTRVVDHVGTTTDIYYATAPTAVESILNFNGNNSTSGTRTTLDSSGRPHISQRRQAYGGQGTGNYDSVEADYDFAGRPSKVTVPYQAGAGVAPSGMALPPSTTPWTDQRRSTMPAAVGRNTPMIGTTFWWRSDLRSPRLQPKTPRDANSNIDALGRLTSVCELTTGIRLRHVRPNGIGLGVLDQVRVQPAR